MGASAGHTAVCMKDEFGNLCVGESGHENEKGEQIIVRAPCDEWWNLALKDDSNPQIASARWNNTAAWEYAGNMSGYLVDIIA